VSALVHSSTLVTAGVYLLIRFSPILQGTETLLGLQVVGVLTTCLARVRALTEVDIKKTIALSTLRQLGLIITTLAFGLPLLTFAHLLSHALFKALLFICRGKVLHSLTDTQDVRHLGGTLLNLPLTGRLISLASFALRGLPFLAGFYTKDLIIEILLRINLYTSKLVLFSSIVGLSASYSLRLLVLTFTCPSNHPPISAREELD